jgi:hypothetical protein
MEKYLRRDQGFRRYSGAMLAFALAWAAVAACSASSENEQTLWDDAGASQPAQSSGTGGSASVAPGEQGEVEGDAAAGPTGAGGPDDGTGPPEPQTGGTAPAATGGTAPVATGGTAPAATGGTAPLATGGTVPVATGGTVPVATGGTVPAATGGTAPAAGGFSSTTGGTVSATGGGSAFSEDCQPVPAPGADSDDCVACHTEECLIEYAEANNIPNPDGWWENASQP